MKTYYGSIHVSYFIWKSLIERHAGQLQKHTITCRFKNTELKTCSGLKPSLYFLAMSDERIRGAFSIVNEQFLFDLNVSRTYVSPVRDISIVAPVSKQSDESHVT